MDDDLLFGDHDGSIIAVATVEPFFCVSGDSRATARAVAARARSFVANSRRPRPAGSVRPAKPDYIRPPRPVR